MTASATPSAWYLASFDWASALVLGLARISVKKLLGSCAEDCVTWLVVGAAACRSELEAGKLMPRMPPTTRPATTPTASIAGPGRGQRVSYMTPKLSSGRADLNFSRMRYWLADREEGDRHAGLSHPPPRDVRGDDLLVPLRAAGRLQHRGRRARQARAGPAGDAVRVRRRAGRAVDVR